MFFIEMIYLAFCVYRVAFTFLSLANFSYKTLLYIIYFTSYCTYVRCMGAYRASCTTVLNDTIATQKLLMRRTIELNSFSLMLCSVNISRFIHRQIHQNCITNRKLLRCQSMPCVIRRTYNSFLRCHTV